MGLPARLPVGRPTERGCPQRRALATCSADDRWGMLLQNDVVHDGVFINDRTLPGGTATSPNFTFNLGIVGVHEVCFSFLSSLLRLVNNLK